MKKILFTAFIIALILLVLLSAPMFVKTDIIAYEADGTPYGYDNTGEYIAFNNGYKIGDTVRTLLLKNIFASDDYFRIDF